MKNKKLDSNSNIQFGEGGAGTFSDGKLQTNAHDPLILKEIFKKNLTVCGYLFIICKDFVGICMCSFESVINRGNEWMWINHGHNN